MRTFECGALAPVYESELLVQNVFTSSSGFVLCGCLFKQSFRKETWVHQLPEQHRVWKLSLLCYRHGAIQCSRMSSTWCEGWHLQTKELWSSKHDCRLSKWKSCYTDQCVQNAVSMCRRICLQWSEYLLWPNWCFGVWQLTLKEVIFYHNTIYCTYVPDYCNLLNISVPSLWLI